MSTARKSPCGRVLAQACALAMRLRSGQAGWGEIEAMVAQAAPLDAQDAARLAVMTARAGLQAGWRTPEARVAVADRLWRDALRAMAAPPVDSGRVDIHG
jgi:hypothetical protein